MKARITASSARNGRGWWGAATAGLVLMGVAAAGAALAQSGAPSAPSIPKGQSAVASRPALAPPPSLPPSSAPAPITLADPVPTAGPASTPSGAPSTGAPLTLSPPTPLAEPAPRPQAASTAAATPPSAGPQTARPQTPGACSPPTAPARWPRADQSLTLEQLDWTRDVRDAYLRDATPYLRCLDSEIQTRMRTMMAANTTDPRVDQAGAEYRAVTDTAARLIRGFALLCYDYEGRTGERYAAGCVAAMPG